MNDVTDRISGVLFGLAAGDLIGGPLAMALTLAESLADREAFAVEEVGQRYFEWWRTRGFDTGPTAARVFSRVAAGYTFEAAAQEVHDDNDGLTAGCNPAHRSVPLAMFLKINDDDLASFAIAEARLTHFHPLAGDVSAAVVRLCRALIRGREWSEALHFASIQRLPETCEALNPRIRFDSEPNGFAPNVLAAAIRFVDQARNFRTALSNSISVDPGTNYVPVLVGSIGGARWGRSAILPQTLKHQSALIPKIESACHALSNFRSIG